MDNLNNNIDLLIFDFFGVISSEVAPIWLKKYFDKERAIHIKNEIVTQVDLGQISESELYSKLGKLANVSPETVKDEWMNLVHINTDLIDYIRKIKTKYKVALLSNASATFLRKILEQNNLYDLFDLIVISAEEKCMKPNPDIFYKVIDKLNINAKKSLMIDDNAINLEGAKSIGINGFLFRNFDSFNKYVENIV